MTARAQRLREEEEELQEGEKNQEPPEQSEEEIEPVEVAVLACFKSRHGHRHKTAGA
jgi:hypothetical protein